MHTVYDPRMVTLGIFTNLTHPYILIIMQFWNIFRFSLRFIFKINRYQRQCASIGSLACLLYMSLFCCFIFSSFFFSYDYGVLMRMLILYGGWFFNLLLDIVRNRSAQQLPIFIAMVWRAFPMKACTVYRRTVMKRLVGVLNFKVLFSPQKPSNVVIFACGTFYRLWIMFFREKKVVLNGENC